METNKVKDQMIKDLKWELDYHLQKVQNASDRLRVLGVSESEINEVFKKHETNNDDETES